MSIPRKKRSSSPPGAGVELARCLVQVLVGVGDGHLDPLPPAVLVFRRAQATLIGLARVDDAEQVDHDRVHRLAQGDAVLGAEERVARFDSATERQSASGKSGVTASTDSVG